MEKLKMQTPDGAQGNIEIIKRFFPNCVTETANGLAIDFEKLQQELSEEIMSGSEERYQFTWPGKRAAIREANSPCYLTLRPSREDSVDFDKTKNLYIEGDNLQVLKLLRESYLGKVKMIYIDPPYNTGNDFVYNDNFSQSAADYKSQSDMFDEDGNMLLQNYEVNSEASGRYHSEWLNMMYPRLKVAKDLLTEDGVIFISIDDNEVENLRKICDEIFGEANFICNFIWKSKSGGANDSRFVAVDHEYVVCYAKNSEKLHRFMDKDAEVTTSYNRKDENGEYSLDRLDKQSIRYSESLDYEIIGPDGTKYLPKHKDPAHPNASWRWSKETVKERYSELVFENGCVYTKNYKKDESIARSLLMEDRFGRTRTGKTDFTAMFDAAYFSSPKPVKLIYFLASILGDKESLILDFFSGSGTSAQSIMTLNAEDGGCRKFLLVQIPEVPETGSEAAKVGFKSLCEIGKERIRRAGKKIKAEAGEAAKDLDIGFRVLKLASSNMNDVYYAPQDTNLNDLFAENIKSDRTPEDLLFQVLPELNLQLSAKIETKTIAGKQVFVVEDNYLAACFDEDITDECITAIAKTQPYHFVMRESGAHTDQVLDNFDQLFKAYSPKTTTHVM